MKSKFLLLAIALPFLAASKNVVVDNFRSANLDPAWKISKGKWEVTDSALKGSELSEDKHNAVVRRPLGIRNGTIAVSIKLDGAKAAHISINQKSGHLFRLVLTPTGISLQKDKPNANSEEKALALAKLQTPITPGVWHTVVIDMKGAKITALVDGKWKLEGENEKLAVEKLDFGFPVSGVSASFSKLSVTGE